MKRVTKELSCQLTEREKQLRGQELAAAVREKLDLEDERKAAMATLKERKEEIDSRVVDLTRAVNSGTEPRQVECEERPHSGRMIAVIRLDTGELVYTRPMEEDELQTVFPDDDDEPNQRSH